jgi:hypothetical protein
VDGILGEAIPAIQSQMVSMSQGCSGGSNGVPPHSWGSLQIHGNTAVNALSGARTALATGQKQTAIQRINIGVSEYDALIDGLHENCSGGAHGVDPISCGAYAAFRNNLKTQLETALRFLD